VYSEVPTAKRGPRVRQACTGVDSRLSGDAVALFLLLLACGNEPTGSPSDDSGTDTVTTPQPAPLTEPSSGECPTLTESGTSTFQSSGEARTVTAVVPTNPPDGPMPLVIFFHGLLDTSVSSPSQEFAASLHFQGLADETGAVVLAPDSRIQDLFGMYEVWLWDLLRDDDHDQVLFDDLRSCAADQLDIDLARVSAVGFSGGALFTTVILSDRGDTLASAVEMSGGSDVDTGFFDSPLSVYASGDVPFPTMLVSGGDTDVWPNTQLAVVDFTAATDTLEQEVVADAHFTVRCRHDRGHTVTNAEWKLGVDWAMGHTFGQPSPFADGLGNDADWCAISEPVADSAP
jgi:poly(3-hydroxybutyrate) depolymerase